MKLVLSIMSKTYSLLEVSPFTKNSPLSQKQFMSLAFMEFMIVTHFFLKRFKHFRKRLLRIIKYFNLNNNNRPNTVSPPVVTQPNAAPRAFDDAAAGADDDDIYE